ncbi:MAG: exodeoxyribonuclease VII large subunit [Candidatus Aenigmarchaeota archaeon]|nr:exodeoxyribonuclease VII large subunit [Candidatus Aenigmarchaeota archaeon]
MDDKKIIKLCLAGSVLSIIVLYFAVMQVGSQNVKVGEITGDFSGKVVNVTGEVSNVYLHKNGHVFFNLKDREDKIRVVVWESDVEQLLYSGVNITGIRNGDKIQIVGTVELYRGEPEIIPVRAQVKFV